MHAALLLAKAGFAVELFEREEKLGGALRYYLPLFRFKRDGIEKKAAELRKLGVEIHLGKEIGKHEKLDKISKRFDSVVLATGEWKERKLGLGGEQLKGVEYWTTFLRKYNEGKQELLRGENAIVIGGGDTAIDCARVAKRLGADATIAYRRSREGMPAEKQGVEAAEQEGVKFRFHLSPVEFRGKERLEAIVFEKTLGTGREMQMTGESEELPAGRAIIASGQQPDMGVLHGTCWNSFAQLPEKIVLAGDLANRERRIAAAIGSAAAAAEKIKEIIGN